MNVLMNVLRDLSVDETAHAILHEFGHRYANLNDVDVYCDGGQCPSKLTPENALKNPDSYAWFAWEVYYKSSYGSLKQALDKTEQRDKDKVPEVNVEDLPKAPVNVEDLPKVP